MRVKGLGSMSVLCPVVRAKIPSKSVSKAMRVALRDRAKKVKKDVGDK